MKNNATLFLFCALMISACHKTSNSPVVDATTTVQPVVDPIYHVDGEVNKLYYNKPNGVNIVVLGDGFIKEDLAVGGNFDKQVKQAIDYLFTVAPYAQNKAAFNVYTVYAESKTRGAATSYVSSNTQTVFNTYFDPTITRLLVTGNTNAANAYVAKAIPVAQAHLIIMIVNDQTYGGSGGNIAVLSINSQSKYIMVHEIGHTFAALGDEYVDLSIADRYPISQLPYMANVDNTNDLTKIKWAKFASLPAYQSLVGAYEGSYYRDKGYYRPELHSVMEVLSYGNYNAPSREAIVKRIDLILGIPYDFNAFVTADAFSIQPIRVAATDPTPGIPRNDFINMKERIQQLEKEKLQ